MAATGRDEEFGELGPVVSLPTIIVVLTAVGLGVFLAVVLLPSWLPNLTRSLLGPEPKAYWFLSRSSAIVAYLLTWLAVAMGLTITSKLSRLWPGGPAAFDVHQHASLLGLAFAFFHALILTGDSYIAFGLKEVLVPFASAEYRPVWVGLGQIAFYVAIIVSFSFYVRQWIGRAVWRALHFLSYALFGLVLLHGIYSGTDTEVTALRLMYWATGLSVVMLTGWRVWVTMRGRQTAKVRRSVVAAGD